MFLVAAAVIALNPCARPQTGSVQELDPKHLPVAAIYSLSMPEGQAAWVVRGKGFTLDLTGRQLAGAGVNGAAQENYTGTGLLIDGAKDVTIKNLAVSGYHQDIVLRNCENVRVYGCTALSSRAIKMGSGGTAIDTFLNLRDIAAWRTYGAGIWLENCKNCRIEKCTATEAQNGIALVNTSNTTVHDNDCSYNGGWGIALWNSVHNAITWNHADFCNRPWKGGWGGDAAGIVVVDGSEKNQIVANSMTHGGDGILITDRTNGGFDKETQKFDSQGASPQNLVAFSDCAWASNNGVECTFSKGNIFYKDIATNSAYGFWLGFSSFSLLLENTVSGNKVDGVAIPQGEGNLLFRNQIEKNGAAGIHIWSDLGPARVAFPAEKNTLVLNRIADSPTSIAEERTIGTDYQSNTIENAALPSGFHQRGADFPLVERIGSYPTNPDGKSAVNTYSHRPAHWKFYSETSGPKGKSALKVGEYGPTRS